jgi:hypothetical protein
VTAEVALCQGENGAPGPCAGLAPAQIVTALRADAASAATEGLAGFAGDPAHAVSGRWYGYLGRPPGAGFTPPPAAPAAKPTVQINLPSVPQADRPAPVKRCRTVYVRVKRVKHKVRVIRRKGRAARRVVKRVVRWKRVKRVRCG